MNPQAEKQKRTVRILAHMGKFSFYGGQLVMLAGVLLTFLQIIDNTTTVAVGIVL